MAHHPSITASELKSAVLDPIWRAAWLAGDHPTTRSFAPPGTPRVLGMQFHAEAQRLVRWLTARDSLALAARIDSADVLLEHLWALSLQSLTERLIQEGQGTEAAALSARLRRFCRHLIELKQHTRGFQDWQDIFVAAELRLGAVTVPVRGVAVEIRARVDVVRFHPQRHLEVVDYKLNQGHRQKADLVQLAIYAHLLSRSRPGCEFCGTLEYYLPELVEVPVSHADLAEIYEGMVVPVLHEMFDRHAPMTAPSRPLPAPQVPPRVPSLPTPPPVSLTNPIPVRLRGPSLEAGTLA